MNPPKIKQIQKQKEQALKQAKKDVDAYDLPVLSPDELDYEFFCSKAHHMVRIALTQEFAEFLIKNGDPGNRNLRREVVRTYVERMKDGSWNRNESGRRAVCVDTNGKMWDGNTRCHARKLAGVLKEEPIVTLESTPSDRAIKDAANEGNKKADWTSSEKIKGEYPDMKQPSVFNEMMWSVLSYVDAVYHGVRTRRNPTDVITTGTYYQMDPTYRKAGSDRVNAAYTDMKIRYGEYFMEHMDDFNPIRFKNKRSLPNAMAAMIFIMNNYAGEPIDLLKKFRSEFECDEDIISQIELDYRQHWDDFTMMNKKNYPTRAALLNLLFYQYDLWLKEGRDATINNRDSVVLNELFVPEHIDVDLAFADCYKD